MSLLNDCKDIRQRRAYFNELTVCGDIKNGNGDPYSFPGPEGPQGPEGPPGSCLT